MILKKFFIIFFSISLFVVVGYLFYHYSLEEEKSEQVVQMLDFSHISMQEAQEYADSLSIQLEIQYEYSYDIEKDKIISQSIPVGSVIHSGDICKVVVSKGEVPLEIYSSYHVNELGSVPIMMYHGIVDIKSSDTNYIGGNVDRDGYNRTVEAFREDLDFYYREGYRMIRLIDYVNGVIDVELGKSPIVLTFDDGNENNFKVLGEENGELVIDPNCAIGVLEEFKKKYPDYKVTATFFVNGGLFGQDEYNEKILKWLIEHGYDVGNHTMTHVDFTKVNVEKTVQEVGELYSILDRIIPSSYVPIIALPFGSPYKVTHTNYPSILNGTYLGNHYETKAALRVGWEAEKSCFDKEFDSTFLKRIRAYDNNGKDFDIEMNFKLLENNRYISDGDKETIVVLGKDQNRVKDTHLRVRTF